MVVVLTVESVDVVVGAALERERRGRVLGGAARLDLRAGQHALVQQAAVCKPHIRKSPHTRRAASVLHTNIDALRRRNAPTMYLQSAR